MGSGFIKAGKMNGRSLGTSGGWRGTHWDGGPVLADNPFWVDRDGGDGRARFARTLLLEGGEASLLYPRCLSDPG